MQFKHIIWDWNGTLLDDAWLWHELSNAQLTRWGANPVTLDQYRDWICHPPRLFFERCGAVLSDPDFDLLGRLIHEDYLARRHHCKLHSGAQEILEKLRARVSTLSVLSAYPHDMLLTALDHFKVTAWFDHIVGHHDHSADSKVDAGKKLLQTIGGNANDTVLIGDSDHDAEVADELGISCLLVSHGLHSRPRLEELGKPVHASLTELAAVL